MNRFKTVALTLLSLLALGACTCPEEIGDNAEKVRRKNQEHERAERNFFDRGNSFK